MTSPAATLPLLPTKLFIPLIDPDVVERARLIERMQAACGAGLILVSAPAGAGKTTLVSGFVQRLGLPVGWLSLDAGDDDPAAFLGYLTEAADRVLPGSGDRARAMLAASPPPEQRMIAHALLADLAVGGAEGVLVIDDYHTVSDPAIHDLLLLLVERMPPAVTPVVITRSDPPLPLSRLRVRRRLTEIRQTDLRFEPDEATEFLARFSGRDVPPDAVATLTRRTEGWAAGLQLAGLAMRSADDPASFIAGFEGTHEYIADYLTDEVLAATPAEVQRFAVRSSLLDRLSGPLCDAALGMSGSQALLDELLRANLFLVRLDGERRWFRYHHLFADLLRRRASEESEAERAEVLARASRWCEENGALDDAVRYASRGGDTDRVAELVAKNGVQAIAAGHTSTAQRWVQRIPPELLASSPDHCLVRAMVLSLTEDHEPIGRLAASASEMLARGQRPHPYVADAELHARWLGAAAQALDGGDPRRSLAVLAEVWEEAPDDAHPVRASTQLVTGILLRLQGRYAEAEEANSRALEVALRAGSDLLRLAAVTGLAENQLLRGDVSRAIATATGELERPQLLHEVLGTQVANLFSILALAHLEQGDLPAAEAALERALAALGRRGEGTDDWPPAGRLGVVLHGPFHTSAPVVFFGLAVRVALLLRRGRMDAARRCLDALESPGAYPVDSPQRVLLDSLRVRLLEAAGDRGGLQRLTLHDGGRSTGCALWDDVRRLTRARAVLAGGDARTACALLEDLLDELRARGSPLGTAEAAVLHALACSSLGHRDDADRATDAALEVTAAQQRTGPWVEVGSVAVPLLERAVDRSAATPGAISHAVSLLAALRRQDGAAAPDVLSERELAVLRLLAAGHTNQQIGRALFLAVGTVKKHTHNIFLKLGVSNRTQAVQAGQARGLIVEIPSLSK